MRDVTGANEKRQNNEEDTHPRESFSVGAVNNYTATVHAAAVVLIATYQYYSTIAQ